jgi:RND family efflux transporter MFP subunit
MTDVAGRLLTCVLLFAAAASLTCSNGASGDRPKAAPAPATVAHPRAEGDLTTVTLSREAVDRLGIQTAAATVERVSGTRSLGGEVVVPEGRAVIVSAPVAGTLVAAAPLRPGSRVERGQPVFRLIPIVSVDRDQHIEAERAVAAAEAEEHAARQRLQRLEQLLQDGAASVKAVEEARAQHEVAAAALAAARDRLKVVSRSPVGPQGEIAMTAPIGGVLQRLTAAVGQTVAASAQLFEIAQVDRLWIRVPVYAGDAKDLDPSQPATVMTLDNASTRRRAEPVVAPLTADPGAATVDFYFELAPGGTPLRPGERVTVEIARIATESGLVIPISALVYDIYGSTWVYEDLGQWRYARRRVEIAQQVGDRAVASRGIAPGTRVVSVGAAELFGTEFEAGK